ncbi:hypothetical protein AB0G04_09100 [Actinoplanes sp. NPDC023801]|uniref:hypothetical protein n=1 Tax=Actinoplanes sp. NPDC023801 TaxID=3154595 RepID=UPI0033CE4091
MDSEPRPIRTGRAITVSVVAGIALAVLWSYEFVDSVIGDNVANSLLGGDAKADAIAGTTAGLVFAFVSGLAGTFTACNIAMAASIGPMAQVGERSENPMRALGWAVGLLTAGMCVVAAVYGFAGVLLGDRLPQLSTATAGGVPVRIIQSSVVFGLIGLALIGLGLAVLGVLPDPFRRRPQLRVFVLGALIGGFLIGRPYPLFNKLFHWAADSGQPLLGSAAFVLQSLGNVLLVTVVFAALVAVTRGGFLRLLTRDPRRTALVAGTLLLGLGVFTVVYWDVRVPAIFGFGWFPTMFYNH